jgi:hypothetical protein
LAKSQRPRPRAGKTVRLRPSNPFDLIRLIAHSQSDARKAMAELVQNSLDAGARNIVITRLRRRREVALSILDDGQGVFPELERPEALERIATNIGHSFKRNLSPAQRQKEMMLGKYGIGILGFWAVGRELEMHSRVAGSRTWALRLVRDEPEAEVFPLPQRELEFPGETWTEVIIRGVHPTAARLVAARRLADYLGSELRGQLLLRQVRLRMVDRLAQSAALKDFLVVPQRFRGRRLQHLSEVPVAGHSPARLELYYVGPEEERRPAVALTCGGTTVAEDLSRIEGHEIDRPPWSSGVLEGVVEFPELEVAPATRRGFVPGPAAEALFSALHALEPELNAFLAREREKRLAEEDESLVREIRKVFRPVARSLPQYDFFEIAPRSEGGEKNDGGGAPLGRTGAGLESPGEEPAGEVVEEGDEPEPEPEILPPGPLARVRIVPRRSKLLPGSARTLFAKAVDESGRRITGGIEFHWTLLEGGGILAPEGDRAGFTAPAEAGRTRIGLVAREGERTAEAEAEIEVVEKLAGERPDAGIPDPQRVFDPSGDWRSRVAGRRWEYNAAHPDYQSVVEEPRRRFRYLVHLLAKEIVLRNYGEPKDERLLERVVEVLTHIKWRP